VENEELSSTNETATAKKKKIPLFLLKNTGYFGSGYLLREDPLGVVGVL